MPVASATWEAEAGGSLEPRDSRLTWVTQQDLISKQEKKKNILSVPLCLYTSNKPTPILVTVCRKSI
jgi:hypothetical protein